MLLLLQRWEVVRSELVDGAGTSHDGVLDLGLSLELIDPIAKALGCDLSVRFAPPVRCALAKAKGEGGGIQGPRAS